MIITLFEPIEKTHNLSSQLRTLKDENKLNEIPKEDIEEMISILDRSGIEEHKYD